MSDYLISVIMPCYNYSRFLSDAIHSLVGGSTCLGEFAPQTFQNFDIWIINDASTDDTDVVGKSFADNDRIHYFANEQNLGTAATLNVGIRQAKGKYITFLSADDMMETTRLEKMHKVIVAAQHRIVYDDMRIFDGKQRTETWPMSDYDFDKTLYKNQMHAGILYPRQAWEECGGYPEAFKDGREDWAFNVALGLHGWCGAHLREPLYLYRRAGQNRSLSNAGGVWRQTFLGKMQSLYPNLYRGERPIMCCGNNKKNGAGLAAARQSRSSSVSGEKTAMMARATAFTAGMDGQVEIEYQLPKAGRVLYTGKVTGKQYAFSSTHPRNYVDMRDAPTFLARIEDRRHAFMLVDSIMLNQNPAPPPMPEEVRQPAPVGVITQEIEITEMVATLPNETTSSKITRKPRKSA